MRYSVCFDALFPHRPLDEVLPTIRSCGYDAVEFWSWWDKDLPLLRRLCKELRLDVAAFCVDFRNNPGDPQQHAAYLDGLRRSIEAAKNLDCSTLIAQAGWTLEGIPFQAHDASLAAVLEAAVPILEDSGTTLVLEPLNTKVDHPGYHMSTSAHAFSTVRTISSPHVKVLFDLYHQQITEGNLLATIRENLALIGHFHIAAVPGRGIPTRGELDYPYIIQAIQDCGYGGFFGLEYMPKEHARNSLETVRQSFPL